MQAGFAMAFRLWVEHDAVWASITERGLTQRAIGGLGKMAASADAGPSPSPRGRTVVGTGDVGHGGGDVAQGEFTSLLCDGAVPGGQEIGVGLLNRGHDDPFDMDE